MSTPRPHLTEGGDRTHASMMAAAPPDAHSVLNRHELQLADHDATLADHADRLAKLEASGDEPGPAPGEPKPAAGGPS